MKANRQTDLQSLDDGKLLEAVLQGEERAWEELLRRFRGLIYRCIHKVLVKFDSVLASETADEIFAELCFNLLRNDMRKLRLYDARRGSKLGSWLGMLSINTAYDHLRVCARQPVLDQIDGCPERVDQSPSPLDRLLKEERWRCVQKMAADFSTRDRHFMDLYFARGMSPAEVAERMEISVKTVYSKKNKIRRRLLAKARQQPTALAA